MLIVFEAFLKVEIKYVITKNKQISASDPLFTVMMQCKSTESKSDETFVRSIVAAPEPMAVLATITDS